VLNSSRQRHDHVAVLGNGSESRLVDAQVRHDRFRCSMSQLFGERKILKTIDLAKHLEEHQISVAGVLDVME
jgi:hypothetical protein